MAANAQPDAAARSPTSERARSFFARNSASNGNTGTEEPAPEEYDEKKEGRPTKWSMGVLNDPITHEVPGMSSNFSNIYSH